MKKDELKVSYKHLIISKLRNTSIVVILLVGIAIDKISLAYGGYRDVMNPIPTTRAQYNFSTVSLPKNTCSDMMVSVCLILLIFNGYSLLPAFWKLGLFVL